MKKTLTSMLTVITLSVTVLSFAPSARATTFEVEIEDFTFVPGGLHINIGDAIEWRNRDDVMHTSTSDDGIWDSGLLARDETFTFVFTTEGVFPYHCSPHPWMVDTIVVGNPTGIDDQLPSIPNQIELSQNYPNPFNAKTSIEYAIPFDSHVKIVVYNLLGQSIETLVNRDQTAGYHQVLWDAADAPTGVYFYRIEAAEFTVTRKMLLAK
jgi:plastocyanin